MLGVRFHVNAEPIAEARIGTRSAAPKAVITEALEERARIEGQGARASVADDACGTDPEGIRKAFFMGVSPRNPAK
jgi:hypothetical protein